MKRFFVILLILALAVLAVLLVLQTVEIRQVQGSDDARISQQMESLKTFVTTDPSQRVPETIAPVPTETASPETLPAETTAAETTAAATTAPGTETAETTVPQPVMPQTTAAPETTVPETKAPATSAPETAVPPTSAAETVPPAAETALLDFDAMRKVNPDIHAWLEIEGTNVDYPVLQSPTDDERYLNHTVEGDVHVCGSLFTQATYNSTDFDDPVTIIYGHTMMSGVFFGQLQDVYSDAGSFREHQKIRIYLPGETREYTVFAAVPYDTTHILHTYDFSKKYWYNRFFDGIFDIRDLTAQFDGENAPSYGDRVVILSMCYKQSVTRRYLVMAVLSEESSPMAEQ